MVTSNFMSSLKRQRHKPQQVLPTLSASPVHYKPINALQFLLQRLHDILQSHFLCLSVVGGGATHHVTRDRAEAKTFSTGKRLSHSRNRKSRLDSPRRPTIPVETWSVASCRTFFLMFRLCLRFRRSFYDGLLSHNRRTRWHPRGGNVNICRC